MQNSQEINWLAILAPSIIVGLSAIIVQILLAYWLSRKTADYQEKVSEKLETYKKDLSKEIEDYKKELNKELEGYKLQIQSDFQTKFYEFQTKYSLLHQQKAEAIKQIYGLLSEVEGILIYVTNDFQIMPETKEERESFVRDNLKLLLDKQEVFHLNLIKNRIFFEKNICEKLEYIDARVREASGYFYNSVMLANLSENERRDRRKKANNLTVSEIHSIRKDLEEIFREYIFVMIDNK
ncbi:MAG: hypothetical protein LUM44_10350 [Pyrinomonadaceae bacterium]|nr:hypothetical protein [Pyrinomonadaceae bacterium]